MQIERINHIKQDNPQRSQSRGTNEDVGEQ